MTTKHTPGPGKTRNLQDAIEQKKQQDLIDDAKREMFGDEADFLDDDMGDQ